MRSGNIHKVLFGVGYKLLIVVSLLQDNIENVSYVWALCRDQSILDHRSAWRVLEFGIQNSSSYL